MRQLCALALGAVLLAACAGDSTDQQGTDAGVPVTGPANGGESNGGQSNAPSGDATGAPVAPPPPTINVYVRFETEIRTDFQAAGVPADQTTCVSDAVATQLRAADQSGALSDGPDLTVRSFYRSPEMEMVFIECEVDPAVVDLLPSA